MLKLSFVSKTLYVASTKASRLMQYPTIPFLLYSLEKQIVLENYKKLY